MHLRDTLLLPRRPTGWADGFGRWKNGPTVRGSGPIHPWRRPRSEGAIRWVPGSRAGRLPAAGDSAAADRRRQAGGWWAIRLGERD